MTDGKELKFMNLSYSLFCSTCEC